MILTLGDIAALRNSLRTPIVVGELPNSIHMLLKLRVPNVYLSQDSLRHIAQKHPDITDLDLLHIPFAVRQGLILKEREKPNILLACYQDPESHKRFVAVMKVANAECEVWLQSFHRLKKRQTGQLLKRAETLKKHD